MAGEEERKERKAALAKAREASEKEIEEAVQLRARTTSAEETASKARERPRITKMRSLSSIRRRALSSQNLPLPGRPIER